MKIPKILLLARRVTGENILNLLGGMGAIVMVFLIIPAGLVYGYESARLFVFGSVERVEIMQEERRIIPTGHSVTVEIYHHVRLHGKEVELNDKTLPFESWNAGTVIYVLHDSTRGFSSALGPENTLVRRLWSCKSGLLLLAPLASAIVSFAIQLIYLLRAMRSRWQVASHVRMAFEKLCTVMELAAFAVFAVFSLILWLGGCSLLVLIVLESKEPSLFSIGYPLFGLALAVFLPIVRGLCWLRDSRYWVLLENGVFIAVSSSLLWTILGSTLRNEALTAHSMGEMILIVMKHLAGLG